jgi:hypothetical protein
MLLTAGAVPHVLLREDLSSFEFVQALIKCDTLSAAMLPPSLHNLEGRVVECLECQVSGGSLLFGRLQRATKDLIPGFIVPIHDEAFAKTNKRATISDSGRLWLRLNRSCLIFLVLNAFSALVAGLLAVFLALDLATSSMRSYLGWPGVEFLYYMSDEVIKGLIW